MTKTEVVEVSAEMIRAYAHSVGDDDPAGEDGQVAPATFVLSLRRSFVPEVEIPVDCFTMYGGHDLTFHAALHAGRSYTIQTRISDTYEKSGRSGRMQVVARQAEVHEQGGGLVVEMVERQIIRRHFAMTHHGPAPEWPPSAPVPRPTVTTSHLPGAQPIVDVGDELGPEARSAPDATLIANFGRHRHLYEQLFVDAGFAQRLGFRNVIVPGPLQSALFEQFLRRQLPGWRLAALSAVFRISIIAGEPIRLGGVITDRSTAAGRVQLECELVMENHAGERATTGHATLVAPTGL